MRVGIDLIRMSEYLEIAGKVANHETEQDETCRRHRDFFADGRLEENVKNIHRESGWESATL